MRKELKEREEAAMLESLTSAAVVLATNTGEGGGSSPAVAAGGAGWCSPFCTFLVGSCVELSANSGEDPLVSFPCEEVFSDSLRLFR